MKACTKVYQLLSDTKEASFNQLQQQSGLNDINLCMSILYLLHRKMILQYTRGHEVYYSIIT